MQAPRVSEAWVPAAAAPEEDDTGAAYSSADGAAQAAAPPPPPPPAASFPALDRSLGAPAGATASGSAAGPSALAPRPTFSAAAGSSNAAAAAATPSALQATPAPGPVHGTAAAPPTVPATGRTPAAGPMLTPLTQHTPAPVAPTSGTYKDSYAQSVGNLQANPSHVRFACPSFPISTVLVVRWFGSLQSMCGFNDVTHMIWKSAMCQHTFLTPNTPDSQLTQRLLVYSYAVA